MAETFNAASALAKAAHLIEAILCDDVCYESPRNLVLLRLAARQSSAPADIEKNLVEAAAFSDSQPPNKWRDAMRSHFELTEFYFGAGNYLACAAELKVVLGVLKRHFSSGNHAMAEMHRLRAFCLKSSGCEFGGDRDLEFAAWMDRGGR